MGLIYESNGTVRLDENSEFMARRFAVAKLLCNNRKQFEAILKEEYKKLFQYELESSKNKE